MTTYAQAPSSRPKPKGRKKIPWLVVLMTSLVVAVYFPSQYMSDTLASLAQSDTGLASTYAAPTLRMWLLTLTVVQLPFGLDEAVVAANAYAPVPFLCWLPNIVVAEYIIRRRRLPSLIRTAK